METIIQIAATGGPVILAFMGLYVSVRPPRSMGRTHWYWFAAFMFFGVLASAGNFLELRNSNKQQVLISRQIDDVKQSIQTLASPKNTISQSSGGPDEKLLVNFGIPNPDEVGTSKITISYFFQNRGRFPVLIRDYYLLALSLNTKINRDVHDEQFTGFAQEIKRCDSLGYIPLQLSTDKPNDLVQSTLGDGTLIDVYAPTRIFINGHETKLPSFSLKPFENETVTLMFSTKNWRITKTNTLVLCPSLRFFDVSGHAHSAICEGHASFSLGDDESDRIFFDKTWQLLPVDPLKTNACRELPPSATGK
ncbi:MAG TPA: hypothetical protein VMV59_02370 [Candidatus Dormibacteraeota bacterium]|nr:hypothetical protein [Candidatus Dormibacteraeota bacterium]